MRAKFSRCRFKTPVTLSKTGTLPRDLFRRVALKRQCASAGQARIASLGAGGTAVAVLMAISKRRKTARSYNTKPLSILPPAKILAEQLFSSPPLEPRVPSPSLPPYPGLFFCLYRDFRARGKGSTVTVTQHGTRNTERGKGNKTGAERPQPVVNRRPWTVTVTVTDNSLSG